MRRMSVLESVRLDSLESTAVITFIPARGYPRLTRNAVREISVLLDAIEESSAFESAVVCSNDDSFAVGAELEEIRTLNAVTAPDFAAAGQALCRRVRAFSVPVVAAIRGYCYGGGLDLALACHGRVAAFGSSFAHPGAVLGLITGWSGTQLLARKLGKSAALQMLLTAERIPASQAFSMGLVDELVPTPDLLETAIRRAAASRAAPSSY
jgi:enoyl-CoA hydratase/carnithine racemase